MDLLAKILMALAIVAPIAILVLVWRVKEWPIATRIIFGLACACLAFLLLWYFSVLIIFRDGMGPG